MSAMHMDLLTGFLAALALSADWRVGMVLSNGEIVIDYIGF